MAEKKRFRFNWFDVAVVLLVLLAGAAWFFLFGRTQEVEATVAGEEGVAIYLIEVTNLTEEQAAVVSIGDSIQEGSQHIPIGRVVDIKHIPYEMRVDDDETQTIQFLEVPDRITMILTVETRVVETGSEILAEGEFAIRGGARLHFTGPGFAFGQSTVLGWERGE